MTTRPLNGSPSIITTPQGQFYVLPPSLVPSDANSFIQLPSLPSVQTVDLRTHPRAAFAPLHHNSLDFTTAATLFSPFVRVKIEEAIAARARASSTAERQANSTLTPSRVSIAQAPSSRDIPGTGCLVFPPNVTFVQDGNPPPQPVPAAAQPQPIPAAAQSQSTRRKRKELDWRDGTPAPYRAAPKAEDVTKVKPEQLPANKPFLIMTARPILPKREGAETKVKLEQLPASTPVAVLHGRPIAPKTEIKAEPGVKSEGAVLAPAPRDVKKARGEIKEVLTPDNYRATIASRRTSGNSAFYQSSQESIDASESLHEATVYIKHKQYLEAVTALDQALFSLHGKEGFVFLLLSKLNPAMRTNTDPRIITSAPEEDLDVLVLRGIYKIKHGKLESAKIALQQVLTHRPHDQLVEILLNHVNAMINYPPDLNWTPKNKTPKQELSGTPPS